MRALVVHTPVLGLGHVDNIHTPLKHEPNESHRIVIVSRLAGWVGGTQNPL